MNQKIKYFDSLNDLITKNCVILPNVHYNFVIAENVKKIMKVIKIMSG